MQISTHSPRKGRSGDKRGRDDREVEFQLTRPAGGDPLPRLRPRFRFPDFNSLAQRGAIRFAVRRVRRQCGFQLTRPAGGRSAMDNTNVFLDVDFNSLAPRGRSGTGFAITIENGNFNSLAPRGAILLLFAMFQYLRKFQLTRPAGGRSPSSPVRYQLIADFNSLAQRGAIRDLGVMRLASRIFQLTRSARGDPKFSYLSPYIMRISTHSPRGGDPVPLPESSIPPPSTR